MKRYFTLLLICFTLSCAVVSVEAQQADSLAVETTGITALDTHLLRNVIISVIILIFAFSLIFVILRFSYKLEAHLFKINDKSEGRKYLLSGFLFFYNGLKWILISAITTYGVVFLLDIVNLKDYWNYQPVFWGIFEVISLTIIFFYLYKLIKVLIYKIYQKFSNIKPHIMEKINYKSVSLFSEDKLIEIAKHTIKLLYYVILFVLAYFYITLLFRCFAFTSGWAATLFGYIWAPIERSFLALINYLPNVFAIVVIFFLIKYALRLIKFIFTAIENEKIVIPNFYKDWAAPTYNIIRFLVIMFGVIVIFPYLPGSSSPFFRGISVFIGVLFSLGSTSAVGNIVAGIVLTYMRPFKLGDRVKIAETVGDVLEKTLLVTRVRTVKNVDITIPNAMVLGSHIVNYSSSTADVGLIVHTSITIGYDVHWQKIHQLMLQAADKVDLLLKAPKPFVLQTALNDFTVNYEINAYTHTPSKLAIIYSELHKNIQDAFAEAGVEIMSPSYTAVRDGNPIAIPK